MVIESVSAKTVEASVKSIPCLCKLRRAFRGSHSNLIDIETIKTGQPHIGQEVNVGGKQSLPAKEWISEEASNGCRYSFESAIVQRRRGYAETYSH